MKTGPIFFILIFLSANTIFPVSTRFISDFRFEKIENFESSNISFVENGGLELSRTYSVLMQSDDLLWDVKSWNGSLLASAGDTATLLSVTGRTNVPVYKNKGHVLFSDIQVWKDRLYLAAIPKAAVYRLGKDFQPDQKTVLSNNYIWQMIPTDSGMLLLTGNPASIQLLQENGKVRVLAVLPSEDNLLKGVLLDQDLYFIGDGNVLYRYSAGLQEKKPVAVASFENPISDILAWNGRIFVITAPKDPARAITGTASFNNTSSGSDDDGNKGPAAEKRSVKNMSGRSAVYAYLPSGSIEEIFDKNNIRFLSLNAMGNSLLIGTDRSAGFFEIPLGGENKRKFTAAGKGKFVRMMRTGDDLYGVLLEPSRIIRIGGDLASGGSFISSPFDTGNISAWGRIDSETEIPPSTGVRLFSRSGAVYNEDDWEDWKPVTADTISSSANRFFQYRVELTSANGKNTPVFRQLVVPYIQKNLPPKFEKLTLDMNTPGTIKVSWEASDDNKDNLVYDLFLAGIGQDWVKINEKPVEESSYDLNLDLFPSGKYRLKVSASDERSNPYSLSKKAFQVSEPFLIDNEPPVISELKTAYQNNELVLRFSATDGLSDIADAGYSLNGGKWIRFLPTDGLFDSRNKEFELKLRVLAPFFIEVKVTDVYGNASVKGNSVGTNR